jgi:hypothetical protein
MKERIRDEKPYERNIATYYFADATKQHVISGTTTWSKYARSALKNAYDNMLYNVHGAMVCVIFDDYFGEDHAHITFGEDGKPVIKFKRDLMKPEIAGTQKDPFGTFIKKLAKSHEKRKIKPTPDEILMRLHIPRTEA